MDKNERIARAVLDGMGGEGNIVDVSHCMTRLRLHVRDEGKVDEAAVRAIAGVIDLKISNGQYQVIIGQTVDDVYAAFTKLGAFQEKGAVDENLDGDLAAGGFSLKGVANGIVNGVVGSTVPILPALIGGGMIKVVCLLITQFALLPADDPTFLILKALGDSVFYFLPVLVGVAASRQFKASLPISIALCTFLVYPNLVAGMGDGSMATFLGLPVTNASYSSSLLPSILIVWVLSLIEPVLKKVIPTVLRTVLVPLLSLLIMLPLSLVVLAPLGDIAGEYVAQALMFLYNTFGFVGMGIMGALRPLLIFTGMHHGLSPFAMALITENGYDPFYFVTGMSFVLATGASCFAAGLCLKDADSRASAFTCATTAVIGGITEPGLYGILFRYKYPLIAVMVANFFAGAWFGLMKVYFWAIPGSTGVFGLPCLIGPDMSNLTLGVIGLLLGCAISFVLTFFLMKRAGDRVLGTGSGSDRGMDILNQLQG